MRILILFIFCTLLGSCGFSHLTKTTNQDTTAPTAKECGSCHVDQYSEWQKSRHAQAYNNKQFKQQSDHYTDTDCLFCHIPGDVQDPKRQTRSYNLNEGVTCVSCHLHDQAMQGPHDSDGMPDPHAVAKNSKVNSKLDSSELCGTCHLETFEQWQEEQHKSVTRFPTCHECHGAPMTRTHTKGTNLFSNILVALEDEHEVRSHHLMLPGQIEGTVALIVELVQDENNKVTFTITNNLPHDLPTGSFGEKQILVRLRRLEGAGVLATTTQLLPTVLSPGQSHTMTLSLALGDQSKHIQIRLLRRDGSGQQLTLIRAYHFKEDDDTHTP